MDLPCLDIGLSLDCAEGFPDRADGLNALKMQSIHDQEREMPCAIQGYAKYLALNYSYATAIRRKSATQIELREQCLLRSVRSFAA